MIIEWVVVSAHPPRGKRKGSVIGEGGAVCDSWQGGCLDRGHMPYWPRLSPCEGPNHEQLRFWQAAVVHANQHEKLAPTLVSEDQENALVSVTMTNWKSSGMRMTFTRTYHVSLSP